MEKQLLKLLLNHTFYLENRSKLIRGMFPDDLGSIYDVLAYAHDKYKHDISVSELKAVHENLNPAFTKAAKFNFHLLLDALDDQPPVSPDIARDLIGGMWRRETARQIAEVAIGIVNGEPRAFSEMRSVLDRAEDNPIPDENYTVASDDLDVLLQQAAEQNRFLFNIPELTANVGGIGRGEFAIIFARPETGKTASWVSLACAPNGWLSQGHTVHAVINEEPAWRTMLRCVSCHTGYDRAGLAANREVVKEQWNSISSKLRLIDSVDFTVDALDGYARKYKPDILVIDQLDKVHIDGTFARDDQRLKSLYVSSREIAKRNNLAVVGLCQASAEAEGKAVLTMDMMENSRTGKAAEADLIIGIGKMPMDAATGEDGPQRTLSIPKNKLTGWHGSIHCMLRGEISRYTG